VAATISLGMIVRNEGRTLRQCLESVAPYVDQIVIGLGGESTDDTEAIAREFTDTVVQLQWKDDFSVARQEVLDLCTGDYFLWVDGDDVLHGGEGLRRLPQEFPQVDAFFFGYDYARDEEGRNTCYLIRERLVRIDTEHRWEWKSRIHEVMVPVGFEPINMFIENILVKHYKPADKHEPDRNMKLLYQELEAQEPNPDPRLLVYLGSENALRGNLKEALIHWQRFIQLSGWDEEKYQTLHKMGDAQRILGNYEKAIEANHRAIEILPEHPDAWLGLAEIYYSMKNYRAAIEYTRIGVSKPKPQTMLIVNPDDYTYAPAVVLGLSYVGISDWELALAQFKEAYKLKQDATVLQQILLLQEEIELHATVNAFLKLRAHLGMNDEWLKIRKLYDVVPKLLEQHPAIQETWQRSMRQTAHIVDPSLVKQIYADNPEWFPVADSNILETGQKYPRSKFAIDVARAIGAKKVVDWGSADGFTSLPIAMALPDTEVVGFDIDPRCVKEANRRAKEWKLNARYIEGDLEEIGGIEGEKADLAMIFEVLEHQLDPADTLRKVELSANHVAITTPYLCFDKVRVDQWDDDRLKPHIRIFDLFDMEKLLTPRGQIWNLYHQEWQGSNGWIFADYRPGKRTDKDIICAAFGTAEEWSPISWEQGGLGGSETAIIKLGEAFAQLGHRMITYGEFKEPGYYYGGAYRPREMFRPGVHSDLFIAWRMPEAADWEVDTDCLILWMHDTDAGDRLTPTRARKFDHIVVQTEWHKQHMLKVYPFLKKSKIKIIGNGVDLTRFTDGAFETKQAHRVIYSSSPDRGLDVILEHVWPKIVAEVPDAELHVYYGWESFDKVSEYTGLGQLFKAKMTDLFLNTKNVVQHGRINQAELAKEFEKASVWLYPTYFTETYCITAIEAQLGGAIPITNHLAGLQETVKNGIFIDGDVRSTEVQNEFAKQTIRVLKMDPEERKHLQNIVRTKAPAYSWFDRARSWLELLGSKSSG
jgi:glycosyltransferase involved in cell wall biosynthesis/tetratricopeptide (TPR) repeat protein